MVSIFFEASGAAGYRRSQTSSCKNSSDPSCVDRGALPEPLLTQSRATVSILSARMVKGDEKVKDGREIRFYDCIPENYLWIPRPVRLAIGWVTVTIFCAAFYIYPAVLFVSALLIRQYGLRAAFPYLAAEVFALVVFSNWPGNVEWPWARSWFQLWYEIFDFKASVSPERRAEYTRRAGPKSNEKFIIAMHPHGIVPIQACLWAAYSHQHYDDIYGFGAAAAVVSYLPVVRQLLGWLTCLPASYETLRRGITMGDCPPANRAGRKPKNMYILAGGLAEVFTSTPNRDIIVYRKRRGLCRLSIETGAKIIPVYVFGGTSFFQNLATGDGFLSRFSRWLRVTFTLFWGQYLLPIPYPAKVRLVVAEPLKFPEGCKPGEPSEECVAELHQRYIESIQKLFDDYKAAAGYPDAKLEIR